MPSCDWASLRPLLASALNERSFSPPMSVTRPTLIFLAGAAAVEVEPPPPPLVLVLLLSLPHAATAKLPMARVRAIRIARNELRCTAPPSRLLAMPALPGPADFGNLPRLAVAVRQSL